MSSSVLQISLANGDAASWLINGAGYWLAKFLIASKCGENKQ
jgi:hypothetical protein